MPETNQQNVDRQTEIYRNYIEWDTAHRQTDIYKMTKTQMHREKEIYKKATPQVDINLQKDTDTDRQKFTDRKINIDGKIETNTKQRLKKKL